MSGKHRRGGPLAEDGVEAAFEAEVPVFEPEVPAFAAEAPEVPAALPAALVDLTPGPPPAQTPAGMGSAAEAQAVLPVGASARRVARESQRRRSRRTTIVILGVVAALVLVAVFGAVKVLGGGDNEADGAGAAPTRPQTTLLLQVVDSRRQTVGAALLGHETKTGTGVGVLIPSSLVVDVPSNGSAAFGATSATGPAGSSALALSDALGVTVDGSWMLDQAGLAALVDAVGGVDVTVDRDVTVTSGGGTAVVAPAGRQHLAGSAAATYATFLAPQEAEQARLARLSEVLVAVLPKLPADSGARSSVLRALGAHASSTLSPTAVAAMLGGLRSDAVGQRLSFDTLPTRELDPGGSGPSVLILDPAAVSQLIGTDFAASRLPQRADGPIRALIQNGVGTPGLGASARTRLVAAGLTYVNGGNAPHFGLTRSYVLILDASAASQRQGAAVAKALGLPVKDVAVTDQGQSVADVVVVLGADYKP